MCLCVYTYDFRQKSPTTKFSIALSLLFFLKGSLHRIKMLRFAGIQKVLEGFRKLVRKLTLFSQFHRSSGRFRKVHGSLSGSLFRFCLYFCSSGRSRKAPGSLSGSLFQLFGLLHSGRFRKVSGTVTGRITKHQLCFFGS